MASTDAAKDAEFAAMHAVYDALNPLDDDARRRVLKYIIARMEVAADRKSSSEGNEEEESILRREQAVAPKYNTFAELFDAAKPKTEANKALVSGYWLQVCKGAESFDGFSANKNLKHLGHGVGNVTVALENLKKQTPSLVLQLKKSGKSQQARKTYKLSVAGIKAVEGLIRG